MLDEALKGVVEAKASEIDFEPVKLKDGLVSIFCEVKLMLFK